MAKTKKKILVFLFDGFSDWELAYLTPEIKKSENFELIYCSNTGGAVTSMGGMKVIPDCALKTIQPESIDLLVLPGGVAWESEENKEVEPLTKAVSGLGTPIASICAATTFLGRLSMLDNVKHTSNDLTYLKTIAPNYSGDENYQNDFAISDRNIITANGIAPIEFAREIFKKIELYDSETVEKWFQLFKNGVWAE